MEDRRVEPVDRAAFSEKRQSQALRQAVHAQDVRCIDHAQGLANVRRAQGSDGDSLAVIVAHIACFPLYGMADGVPIVQDAAQPALPFVLRDDFRLDLARAPDHVKRRLWRKAQRIARMIFEIGEERLVKDDAILDDLAEPRANLALGQRGKGGEVGEDGGGLIERTDG